MAYLAPSSPSLPSSPSIPSIKSAPSQLCLPESASTHAPKSLVDKKLLQTARDLGCDETIFKAIQLAEKTLQAAAKDGIDEKTFDGLTHNVKNGLNDFIDYNIRIQEIKNLVETMVNEKSYCDELFCDKYNALQYTYWKLLNSNFEFYNAISDIKPKYISDVMIDSKFVNNRKFLSNTINDVAIFMSKYEQAHNSKHSFDSYFSLNSKLDVIVKIDTLGTKVIKFRNNVTKEGSHPHSAIPKLVEKYTELYHRTKQFANNYAGNYQLLLEADFILSELELFIKTDIELHRNLFSLDPYSLTFEAYCNSQYVFEDSFKLKAEKLKLIEQLISAAEKKLNHIPTSLSKQLKFVRNFDIKPLLERNKRYADQARWQQHKRTINILLDTYKKCYTNTIYILTHSNDLLVHDIMNTSIYVLENYVLHIESILCAGPKHYSKTILDDHLEYLDEIKNRQISIMNHLNSKEDYSGSLLPMLDSIFANASDANKDHFDITESWGRIYCELRVGHQALTNAMIRNKFDTSDTEIIDCIQIKIADHYFDTYRECSINLSEAYRVLSKKPKNSKNIILISIFNNITKELKLSVDAICDSIKSNKKNIIDVIYNDADLGIPSPSDLLLQSEKLVQDINPQIDKHSFDFQKSKKNVVRELQAGHQALLDAMIRNEFDINDKEVRNSIKDDIDSEYFDIYYECVKYITHAYDNLLTTRKNYKNGAIFNKINEISMAIESSMHAVCISIRDSEKNIIDVIYNDVDLGIPSPKDLLLQAKNLFLDSKFILNKQYFDLDKSWKRIQTELLAGHDAFKRHAESYGYDIQTKFDINMLKGDIKECWIDEYNECIQNITKAWKYDKNNLFTSKIRTMVDQIKDSMAIIFNSFADEKDNIMEIIFGSDTYHAKLGIASPKKLLKQSQEILAAVNSAPQNSHLTL
jgi:hypothetical protein